MTTLYWWYKNAPANRPGGPWWAQTFTSAAAAFSYIESFRPFLHALYVSGEPIHYVTPSTPAPPRNAEKVI